MIPILYEKDESNFTSNGLGRLPDATECYVLEERNGSYELSMMYPIDGRHFSDLAVSRFIYAVPADGKGPQPFRIYSISKPLNGIVDVRAEHVSYQLSHIPVSPFEASSIGAAMIGLGSNAAETCPFTFWTDKTTTANFKVEVPTSIRSLLGGVQGSILDVFGGGEYEFDHYDVKLYQHRGDDRGVSLRYGKNITDIKQEENIANTYTGIMPFWKGADSTGSGETVVTLTEKVLHSPNAQNFPYQRTIPLDLSSSFESQPTEAQLRSAAQSFMTANNIGVPSVSIDVSFVALWQTEEYKDIANLERINLCDTVTVEFPTLEISATAKVVKTEYDVLKERYKSIELGEARTNFAETVRQDIIANTTTATKDLPTKSFLKQAVDRATRLITGGLGGHVVMNLNADGEPQEILIMDTDDVQTAVNVLRINQNGIGFSTTGYAGPFTSAWTIDGHFVADFIDTGNLNASLITTGTLLASLIQSGRIESNNGLVYFDLDNNELACSKLVSPDVWGYTPSRNPGNPIISVLRGQYGSSSNPTYYALIGMYKEEAEDYGLYFDVPKDSSDQNSDIYSVGDVSIYAGANNKYGPNGYGGYLQLKKGDSSTVFRLAAESSSGVENAYIYGTGSGNITFYTAEGLSFYGPSSAYVSFHSAAISTGFKSRLMETESFGNRLLYCYEMPTPIFGDVGSGTIGEDGYAVISVDELFDETTRTDLEYFVFLQAEGEGELYIEKKHRAYFVVKGTPNLRFVWEIKAKQKDSTVERFEPMPEKSEPEYDFEADYYDEIENFFREQEELLYETA